MAFDITGINPFIQSTGAVGGRQSGRVNGGGFSPAPAFGGAGGSQVDRELADMRRFIQPFNGTGQLQPHLAEKGLFVMA